jgi:hypothetical protein
VIAGVTHVTMEAALDRGIEFGIDLGLLLEFVDEVALPAAFERVEEGDHRLPLALLTGGPGLDPRGVKLEIVQHRLRSGRRGAYTGLFRCPVPAGAASVPGDPRVAAVLRTSGLLRDPVCAITAPPDGEAWFDAAAMPGGGLAGILCVASDVWAETAFWSTFARFTWRDVGAEAAWASMSWPVLKATCEFVVIRGAGPARYAMNDSGFPSIGVYSTAVDVDCDRAVAAGAKLLAAPIGTTVGGRRVRMALVATPGGAPVELLSVQRG